MPASEATESIPVGHCRTCGLAQSAHGQLADHPEELKLRKVEQDAAETLKQLARKAARALEAHERVDAVVLLTQLEVVVDNLRKGMVVAINDQMKATREASNGG
jgi:hypothetical protein